MKRKRTRTLLAGGLFFCFLGYRDANDSEMQRSEIERNGSAAKSNCVCMHA